MGIGEFAVLLQADTPETLIYMLIGYAIFFGLPLFFVLSLWWRQRNLEKDVDVLEELKKEKTFDLGLCTSVFQYLSDEELEVVLPVMAKRIRYLYFSVPTNLELKRQVSDLDFKDEYAIHRTREKYLKLLRPHFTFISSRLLESKVHFNEETTHFTDLLFRF